MKKECKILIGIIIFSIFLFYMCYIGTLQWKFYVGDGIPYTGKIDLVGYDCPVVLNNTNENQDIVEIKNLGDKLLFSELEFQITNEDNISGKNYLTITFDSTVLGIKMTKIYNASTSQENNPRILNTGESILFSEANQNWESSFIWCKIIDVHIGKIIFEKKIDVS